MPSRPVCAAILLFWAYAAGALFRRDMLPDLWTQPPPDLRAVANAEGMASAASWDLSVAEETVSKGYRSVGTATTSSSVEADGEVVLESTVEFDSGKLLKGTPFAPREDGIGIGPDDHVKVISVCRIDRSGNLKSFRADVKGAGDEAPSMLSLDGRVVAGELEIRSTGPIPLLNWTRRFPYESRGMIQNAVGPIDRLPGLQVGQRWETRVVSPLTGRVETIRTEVQGRHLIIWNNVMVPTNLVVQHLAPIRARTWVRLDGLVLKQEIPFPFVKLILERRPVPTSSVPGTLQAETKVP